MKSSLSHLQLNINIANLSFYKEMMALLGWNIIFENDHMIGFSNDINPIESIWFSSAVIPETQNHDAQGLNHIGFEVKEQKNVDEVVEFLKTKQLSSLYDTPRHRPEFSSSTDQTYYQVMFASADNILFEVKYSGVKAS